MKWQYQTGLFILLLNILTSCNGQISSNTKTLNNSYKQLLVGGGCDGCELMYVGMPAEIKAIDTSAGWYEKGQKLIIKGIVFKQDKLSPAADVIIYYWQTDQQGYYSPVKGMDEQARRHGHLRGWVKTNEMGEYAIFTLRPAPYPNDIMPAHIHLSVKEPGIEDEYYIDEIVFDDDQFLAAAHIKNPPENRGGSGILSVKNKADFQIAEHTIILGLNIPNYPNKKNAK